MTNFTRLSRLAFVNAYLVREDDGFTVIDTMLPLSAKRIVREAERQAVPIVRILLTHAHGDHVGSLDDLAGMVGDAEVIISERDARLLRRDRTMDPGEPDSKLRGSFPGAKTSPNRMVNGGDRIGSLEVGKEGDFVVLDPDATPLMAYRSGRAESTEELMFVLSIMADDRAVQATYVAGRPAYERRDN